MYNILISGAIIGGTNMLFLSFPGITSNVFEQFISQLKVNEDIVADLMTETGVNFIRMDGQLVKCDKNTFHLTRFNLFKSSSVQKQVNDICRTGRSLAVSVQLLAWKSCQQEFVERVYEDTALSFVTSDPANILALEEKYKKVV